MLAIAFGSELVTDSQREACAVGAMLAESISLVLGRGLLYSALFVLIFAAALFALTFEKKQAAPAKAAQ